MGDGRAHTIAGMAADTREKLRFWLPTILAITTILLAGCSQERKLASARGELTSGMFSVLVTSDAFRNAQPMPAKYTATGGNVSPQLSWSGHSQAAEYILIVEDADSSGSGPAVQWLVYHIPRNVTSLPANASATGGPFAQGKNYKGQIGYAGPDISSGKPHRFFFQVFAIDTALKLDAGADLAKLKQSFDGTVLCTGQLIGTSGPPQK